MFPFENPVILDTFRPIQIVPPLVTGDLCQVADAAKAAGHILEWIELGDAQVAIDLAVRSHDVVLSVANGQVMISAYGFERTFDGEFGDCIRKWCDAALRNIREAGEEQALEVFLAAFSGLSRERFHGVVIWSQKAGLGSLISPSDATGRQASHFFELDMLGITGRSGMLPSAIENWRNAAFATVATERLAARA